MNEPRWMFDELNRLIVCVQDIYSRITNEWSLIAVGKVNLKRFKVCDIDINGVIYNNMMEYTRFLNEKSAEIMLQLLEACSCQVTARVKTQNSIEDKIQRYMTGKHMFGKVPVNKCFNDLFGVRIILEYPMSFSAILSFVEDAYHGKYKCIDSSNLDYKAVHVYFKENNDFFQWELQVWNRCDVSANLSSHKKYKQRYTTVEQENEKGGLF